MYTLLLYVLTIKLVEVQNNFKIIKSWLTFKHISNKG